MAIIRYYVTSEMFGDKERVFDDKAELNTWLHAKTTRMVLLLNTARCVAST